MRPELAERYFWPPSTFMSLTPQQTDYGAARIVVLPVPYDATSSGPSAGAREGPRAIIGASQEIELFDLELACEPATLGIHTLPDLKPVLGSPEAMLEAVRTVADALLDDDKLVLSLGGDHSLTIATVAAHRAHYPQLGVLYLDAHADLRDEYLGTRYGHGSAARRVLEGCPLVQVGVRSVGHEEASLVAERRRQGSLLTVDDVRGDLAWTERVVAQLPEQVYVSVDLDVFDPSIVAAVDLPEPGGLHWHEVLALLRLLGARRRIVGCDVVELSPREGPRACAFLAARLAYKLIGYATVERT